MQGSLHKLFYTTILFTNFLKFLYRASKFLHSLNGNLIFNIYQAGFDFFTRIDRTNCYTGWFGINSHLIYTVYTGCLKYFMLLHQNCYQSKSFA